MRVVDEEPMQTVHLYVVPEEDLPPQRDYQAIIIATLCSLFLLGLIVFSVLAPSPTHEVSFTIGIHGFSLAPVTKTLKVTVLATGNGHVDATYATGTITFYNGAIYTQIIPVGTILKGSDGIGIITDEQAVIPPAAQTTPPTYGHSSVSAHALVAGRSGNIQAGDINIACCVTSVIAQNPYTFTGGKNARDFSYLTAQDVTRAISPILSFLQAQTIALFPTPIVLNLTCTTRTNTTPAIGQEAQSAAVIMNETCTALSYSTASVKTAIASYGKHIGRGTLSHVQTQIVGISKGETIKLFVTAIWNPSFVRRFPSTGK